jgi:hypothetical protein
MGCIPDSIQAWRHFRLVPKGRHLAGHSITASARMFGDVTG